MATEAEFRSRRRQTSAVMACATTSLALAAAACGRLGPWPYGFGVTKDDAGGPDSRASFPVEAAAPTTVEAGRDATPKRERDAASEREPETGQREASTDGPTPPVGDAAREARDATARRDATLDVHDANTSPDCRCPADEYYVDVDANGQTAHLTFPYALSLYCDETAPQLAHPSCGSVYRLSACAGTQSAPPCLYLAVDGVAPVIGIYVDATGQTFTLVSGEIAPPTTAGRVATGSFSAIYTSRTTETSISVIGAFRACTTVFPPCKR